MLGGVPGVAPANVLILGGGVVGHQSAKIAVGMGANVTIIDRNLNRLRELDDIYSSQIVTLASNEYTIRESLRQADLVIGAVLIPGASAPHLVKRDMLPAMRKGSVMVDVAIDQVGVSKPRTRPRIRIPFTSWTACCTIVCRTCRRRCRIPRPSR